MTKNEAITSSQVSIDGLTVRTYREHGMPIRFDVFNSSGYRIGVYKTERGMRRAVNRNGADVIALSEYTAKMQAITKVEPA